MADQGRRESKDLFTRLADAGEEAIQRLAKTPGADQMMGAVTSLRDRMDELQKRVRGIDALEKRVEDLEKRLDAQTKRSSSGSSSSKSSTSSRKTSTTRKRSSARTGGKSPG